MDMLNKVTDLVDSAGKNADNLTTSKEEVMQQVTTRHQTDMLSDSWLSKNIRPIAFIFALTCQFFLLIAVVWLGAYDKSVDPWIIGQVGTLMITTTSFYFNSRKGEKVAATNASANMKMREMELKHEQKMSRKEFRKAKRDGNN